MHLLRSAQAEPKFLTQAKRAFDESYALATSLTV
jgi:hypothetical protein